MQNTSGSTWDSSYINFSISNIRYDANGNILGLNRSGFKVGGSSLIDQLNYSYQYNKLLQVTDTVNDVNSKLGDFHYNPATKATVDYRYDGSGSILADNNKNIDTTSYNHLGLPQLIHMKGEGNVQYTYDASGSKLTKLTVDSVSRHTTTTLYVAGFVYQQTDTITNPGGGIDTLQFVGHAEGRVRWALHRRLNGTLMYGWEYDFFEKDQLGNTRILLTQQKDTSQYLATMEAAYRNTENKLFFNLSNTGYARNAVSGYPVDTTITNPNDSLARVNGNGNKVGPGIILKVMSGDKVDIAVQSYYNNITDTAGPSPSINDVLASLATGIVSMTGGTHGGLTDLNNTTTSPVYAAINSFQGANNPASSGKPKAYLNWILLDDQFKYVSSYPQSGAVPVGTANHVNALGYTGIPITKSGYLYVYVSNETPGWDAFFDNLSVKQYSGPMLEETHYYPFGLTMAAISDKAMKPNYTENKFRYNGGNELQNKEFSDGSGLELYDAQHRMLDPQLGRFGQIDPIADAYHSVSPYSFANDNPISMLDPDGLRAGPNGTVIGPGGPTPSPYDTWLFSSFSSSSDLWNNMERSQQETDQQIQGEFAQAGEEADNAYASSQWSTSIMGQISSFLLAKVGDEGEAHANFSTVEGGPSKIRVDYGYGINDGSEDALNTYVQGVSIFNSGNGGYPTGFKQFIAIAVGESGGNFNEIETKAIASSMINRINQASTSLNDPNWLKKISYGGNTKTNFVAIAGNNVDYNAVMGMSLNKITNSSNKYIKAAISAYDNWEVDYSNPKGFPDTGLYYWNASKGMAGSSYGKNPDNYIITLTAGGTTFYRPK
jgi:RHS repeat-associated protein